MRCASTSSYAMVKGRHTGLRLGADDSAAVER